MGNTDDAIAKLLLDEAKFHLNESLEHVCQCLDQLTEDEIWHHPNEQTTSIGNLVLHLCGHVREWILTTLGSAPDDRIRSEEFSEKGPIPTKDMKGRIEGTISEALEVIDNLQPSDLTISRHVRGDDVTGVDIIVHVVQHFSYHTGEITYAVKTLKAIDLKYYEDEDVTG